LTKKEGRNWKERYCKFAKEKPIVDGIQRKRNLKEKKRKKKDREDQPADSP